MIFVTEEARFRQLVRNGHTVLKCSHSSGTFTDAWMSEEEAPRLTGEVHADYQDIVGSGEAADGADIAGLKRIADGKVYVNETANGLFGYIAQDLSVIEHDIQEAAREAYRRIFERLSAYPRYTVIRYWNYVPAITQGIANGATEEVTVYQLFNAGRYEAFAGWYGTEPEERLVPAASAVGTEGTVLLIEWLAVASPIAMIENKDQVPAYRYSEKYGKVAPFFSRGVIFSNHGQRLLLSSGTASVRGEDSLHAGDIYEQLSQSMHNLRILGSQFNLKKYQIHYGFALEDIVLLRVYYKCPENRAFLERMVPRFLAPICRISYQEAAICRDELLVELEAVFVKKGESEAGDQPKYRLDGGRIRTESFEIHVAEHCNLSCRDCCNISPFNAKKFMSLEEVARICGFVSDHFIPDVFKVVGGEPTLHPQLDAVLKIVKGSPAGKVVRVVSNGLLLHRMTEDFWKNIDQLTISNYISAPVKPAALEEIRKKARKYEVVLNIKFVEQFNEIFVEEPIGDPTRIGEIYADCWMRHRCLIIRNDRFYKCTRAAYMDDYLRIKGKPFAAGETSYSVEDGIALDDPAFAVRSLAYLNAETALRSCEYCLGVSGDLRENVQLRSLRRAEIHEQESQNRKSPSL